MQNKKFNVLCESSETIELLTEQTDKGKVMYIEGIFAQAEVKNGNGRIYEHDIMHESVEKYNSDYVSKKRALGELTHPDKRPFPDPSEAALITTEMKMRGNDVIGKARILNTPKGQVLQGLLEGGVRLGVSTRGLGTVKESKGIIYVQSPFIMTAVDAVDNPSAPNAYPNPIMENRAWILNESTGNWYQVVDETESAEINEEMFLEKLSQFIKRIKTK